jgi:DNA mismatch endonuclease (patch repair protein)
MDKLSRATRSALMGRIRSCGTSPERRVASILRRMRYRFHSNDSRLPGTPDFVLPRRKVAIFVHGCFWHTHTCRRGMSKPATRAKFWERKRKATLARDRRALRALRMLGYRVVVLWECKLKDVRAIEMRISRAGTIAHPRQRSDGDQRAV